MIGAAQRQWLDKEFARSFFGRKACRGGVSPPRPLRSRDDQRGTGPRGPICGGETYGRRKKGLALGANGA